MSFKMPGKILEEYTVRNNRLGLVQVGNTRRPIFLDLVPDAHIGDYVRVHVGFAVEQVEKLEAEQAYAKLAQNGKWKTADVALEAALEADEALPEAALRVKTR
ncbi:MAG TPA: HypC/HybG/HupF family hydrogenase formation chaperone [Bryobacteraceae bacterium]